MDVPKHQPTGRCLDARKWHSFLNGSQESFLSQSSSGDCRRRANHESDLVPAEAVAANSNVEHAAGGLDQLGAMNRAKAARA